MSCFRSLQFAVAFYCILFVYGDVVFDDSAGIGRQFDGIGGLSGGGATSKLLVNYPEKERNEILDYLFKPNFGASLQILKVEIGGDAQSTDGTEASHMHNAWDENYERGYEWWLMVEAKKRNPNIKLYALSWAFPGWLGVKGDRSPYSDPALTASYIMKWIEGAKSHYNLTIDYIGIWNERNYDITYIKTLRQTLDSNNLSHVRIVAADGGWGIADDMLKDAALASSIDYIGVHYPGTSTTTSAMKTGKQLWSSEDYSTYNDNIGGGCWARILNQNYVNGFMTSTISWNLIASYYQSLPFYRDGLMTAVEPWIGHYVVQSPIWLGAHTTQFTDIGWQYLRHGSGVGKLTTGGSYVGLTGVDNELTIVLETMTHDHSLCIRPSLPAYNVTATTLNITFKGSFASLKQLNVWYSKPSYTSEPDVFFVKKDPLMIVDGKASLKVNPDEVYTLTTLTRGQKGSYETPPASQPFPLPYSDDFEGYDLHMEPFDLAQQMGSYEIAADTTPENKFMRQMVLTQPVSWCQAENQNASLNLIGNNNWTDIRADVDIRIGNVNNTKGAFVAVRVAQGGCSAFNTMGVFFFVFPNDDLFIVADDLARTSVITSGKLMNVQKDWNTFSIMTKGTTGLGWMNGNIVFNVTVSPTPANGFVGVGTDSWGLADFDNLKIANAQALSSKSELPVKADRKLYFKPGVH